MKSFKLIILFWRHALLRAMAYPAHFWFLAFVQIAASATTVIAIVVVFTQTTTLAGWSRDDALALVAIYGIVLSLLKFFFEASFTQFCRDVHTGGFDFYLIRPVDPRLALSFGSLLLDQLGFFVPNALLLVYLIMKGLIVVTLGSILGFIALLLLGLFVGYCLFFALTLFVFWIPTIEHFSYLYGVIVSFVRFPLDIYGTLVRRILLTIVPIGFLVTVPAEFLVGVGSVQGIAITIVMAAVVFLVTQWWWRFAVRHYSSASS